MEAIFLPYSLLSFHTRKNQSLNRKFLARTSKMATKQAIHR